MHNNKSLMATALITLLAAVLFSNTVMAAPSASIPRKSDIRNTKHNLSATGTGDVKALTESQVCVFCHTPHAATSGLVAPLWNRAVGADNSYTQYDSNSTQANIDINPGGSSKLCLSCHDGTIAIGNVNVLEGNTNVSINMLNTDGGKMPAGMGAATGFTRKLGTNLENDHPISFSFDTSKSGQRLAKADGELRDPMDPDGSHIAMPTPGVRPMIPLDHNAQVQCISCHDPHIDGQDLPPGTSLAAGAPQNNIKFLRGRRFQMTEPLGGNYNKSEDIVCLACHDKLGQAWSDSAHAQSTVADEFYNDSDADLRDFPRNIRVWQAACLNCHDTHTVEGSRRLLREGTDNMNKPKTGGNPAIEETCYQCHDDMSRGILQSNNNKVPDIKSEFLKSRRMPITNNSQLAGMEVHDIKNADFTEDQSLLGYNNLMNRHAECTDCHNPHRLKKNSKWDGSGDSSKGTHDHTSSQSHTNEISGVLYGAWGVEPVYGPDRRFGTSGAMPIGFTVKRGITNDRVTAEYQICLKCHSNYAFNDDGAAESNTRPETGGIGLTPYVAPGSKPGTNSFRYYTNQSMEFQAPSNHAGETTAGVDGGASSDYNSNNHRAWHPVMRPTGRTPSVRGNSSIKDNFLPPFNNNVGNLTMYCTDCHGASNDTAANSEPPSGTPWGPHGSNNNFILRGKWSRGQAKADGASTLCFKCHKQQIYAGTGSGATSGFSGFARGCMFRGRNLHEDHNRRVGTLICTWCHTAVPHGWKNKNLLVNLEDIGPEAVCRDEDNTVYNLDPPCTVGQPIAAGTRVGADIGGGGRGGMGGGGGSGDSTGYNNPPYYINARLRVRNFAKSSSWSASNCFSRMTMMSSMCNSGASY